MPLENYINTLTRVVQGKASARTAYYLAMGLFHRTLNTGNRRYEFERLYAEEGDSWNYFTNPYEREKYARTLSCIVEWRRKKLNALEIGCSVGAFTQMLAQAFDSVTAIDLAQEALDIAAIALSSSPNVTLLCRDVLSLDIPQTFDVITCNEILYYIREQEANNVCRVIERHMKPEGLTVLVNPVNHPGTGFSHGWDTVFDAYFERQYGVTFTGCERPYRILAYSRRRS
jgi:2-polyprenyl-3-methyl-5-hydroxy-6-metoxy-1,4-benzoquinol methylase